MYDSPFLIDTPTRRQHIYSIGKTGVGKTTMLEHMIHSDIKAGRGFCVIDPHGSLNRRIADAVGDRVQDTILFEPIRPGKVPVFNMFNEQEPGDPAITADNAGMSLQHIWPDSWGNRMDDILKMTFRILIDNRLSLADVPRVLNDKSFRERLTCNDPYVADFWQYEYNTWSNQFREVAISPILNKLRPFSTNQVLKRVVDGNSNINIRDIMLSRKILLVSLSKRMGIKTSKVIGSLFVSRIAQAALDMDTLPEEQLQDFTLYIDEFQNFTSEAMSEILAEARKYKLSVVLAHQYRDQIENKSLRAAVLNTASTAIIFRVGAQDAEELAAELGMRDSWGYLRPNLLTELPNYSAYIKTLDKGMPTEPRRIDFEPSDLPTGSFQAVLNNTIARYT